MEFNTSLRGVSSGGGNATVPNDAPIQPAQAFVDYMYDSVVGNNPHQINFSLPSKGVTAAYGWINNNLVEDFLNGNVPGIDLHGNALSSDEVESIISLASLSPANIVGIDADRIINVSGGTSADPNNGATGSATDDLLWVHDPSWWIKVNINGLMASINPYGAGHTANDPVCDFRGTNMTTGQVNALLSYLVTNHISDYAPAPALHLEGAGMGAPSGQGIVNKAALNTAGWTVTTN